MQLAFGDKRRLLSVGRGEALRTEELNQAAAAFDAAAMDSAAWPAALSRLASATRSSRAELVGLGSGALAFCVSDLPQDAYRKFDAEVGYGPRFNARVAAALKAAPMQVVGDPEYEAVLPTLRTTAFRDCVKKLDIPHGCQATLVQKPGRLIGLAVLRTAKEGRVDTDATEAFTALTTRALAAVRTRLMLGDRTVRDLVSGLEYAGVAAIVCDGDGKVRAFTPEAERLLRSGDFLKIRDQRLAAVAAAHDGALQRHIGRALAGSTEEMVMFGSSGVRACLHLRALPSDDWDAAFSPRMLILIRERPPRPSPDVLRLAFGFTPVEAEIVLAIAEGIPRERIAANRSVTLGTLRQQLKSVFAKAGVSRETELVLAVLALA